jgi:LysR family glycine cleavage system transcriptional activator
MTQSFPSLNALKAFECAARHLSFSKAAAELNVTSAAISHRIRTLEEHLGVELFYRLNKGVALTDAGISALPDLQLGFCRLAKAVERLRGGGQTRLLTVQSAPSFAAKWLAPRLSSFAAEFPQFDVRIVASIQRVADYMGNLEIGDEFRESDIDVAIHFGRGKYEECRSDRLFGVAAVPLCSPELLQGEHAIRTPADLSMHTLLHDDTPHESHPEWKTWLAQAGVTNVDPERGLRFSAVAMVLDAAERGQGVALSLEALATDAIAAGRLVTPFDIRLPVRSAYYLICLEKTAEVERIVAFRDWILGEAERFKRVFPEPTFV